MAVIPIDVQPEEILIQSDRRLSYEVVTAFRSPNANPNPSIRVLERRDPTNQVVAAFSSPVALPFGKRYVLKTVELVTFLEPGRVEFELVEPNGLLRLLEDRFVLDDIDGWTRFRYESRFGIGGWIFGWLLGKLVFETMFRNHMRHHLEELREMIEARARKSRKYSQPQTSQPAAVAMSSNGTPRDESEPNIST